MREKERKKKKRKEKKGKKMSVKIPKIIMQTWKTTNLPDKWQPSQNSIRKYMPSWTYILMTDDMNFEFIKKYFPDFVDFYNKFPYPIQKADAIRYCWLYVHGGLYIDCDFELLEPLDLLFYDDSDTYLVPSSNNNKVYTNSIMASKPGNKLWLEMIEYMKTSFKNSLIISIDKHLLIMKTTGPMALTSVVNKSDKLRSIILDPQKINPYSICDKVYNKRGAMVRPLEGSSWVGTSGFFYQWCYCNSDYIYGAGLVLLLIVILLIFLWYNNRNVGEMISFF